MQALQWDLPARRLCSTRTAGISIHQGTLLCGPYSINTYDAAAGEIRKRVVLDPGDETGKLFDELDRMVRPGATVTATSLCFVPR